MADSVVHLAWLQRTQRSRFVQCRSARVLEVSTLVRCIAEREGRSGLTCSTERTNPRQDSDGRLD